MLTLMATITIMQPFYSNIKHLRFVLAENCVCSNYSSQVRPGGNWLGIRHSKVLGLGINPLAPVSTNGCPASGHQSMWPVVTLPCLAYASLAASSLDIIIIAKNDEL